MKSVKKDMYMRIKHHAGWPPGCAYEDMPKGVHLRAAGIFHQMRRRLWWLTRPLPHYCGVGEFR